MAKLPVVESRCLKRDNYDDDDDDDNDHDDDDDDNESLEFSLANVHTNPPPEALPSTIFCLAGETSGLTASRG